MISPATRRPRPLVRLALLAALVLAGCGGAATHSSGQSKSGTHSTSTPQHLAKVRLLSAKARAAYCQQGKSPCVTVNTALKAVGSPYIDVNLEKAMALNQPTLEHPKVTCPSSTRYPVHCTLTGSENLNGERVAIKGTVTVIGISTINQTYAYEVLTRPAKG